MPTRRIAGIDPSYTATGIAHTDGTVETVIWRGEDRCRLLDVHDRITSGSIWADGVPDLVVVEGYAHGARNAAHKMGELGGIIRVALMHADVEYVDCSPSQLKKLATGKGNAGKEAVFAAAIRKLDYEGNSTDEADALWLRQWGLALP